MVTDVAALEDDVRGAPTNIQGRTNASIAGGAHNAMTKRNGGAMVVLNATASVTGVEGGEGGNGLLKRITYNSVRENHINIG